MERWICTICQYVYDPEAGDPDRGIPAGTPFESLPDDWTCPLCGAGKDDERDAGSGGGTQNKFLVGDWGFGDEPSGSFPVTDE